MACNCGKRKLSTQPKKIVRTQPNTNNSNKTNATKRIIRRAAR